MQRQGPLNEVGRAQDFIQDQREDPVYAPLYGELGQANGANASLVA